MNKQLTAAAAALALLAAPIAYMPTTAALAAQDTAAAVSTPEDFAKTAAAANMFEIESSRLALEKASSDEVKQFAQHMIDDHTKAGDEMKQAAQADGVTDIPSSLDDKHQAMLDELEGTSEDQFDAAYVDMQVNAHKEAVDLFEGYSKQDGELAKFAQNTLPTLEEHYETIQKVDQ